MAAYTALAGVVTWPLVLDPGRTVVGGARTDVHNALWSYWFVAEGLRDGHFPVQTALLNHPAGGRILVADPLNAALAAPLTLAGGPALAYSVTVLVHLALGAWFADAAGRALGGRGWIAGVAYAASPIVLSHLQNGSSEAAAVAWLPLAAWLGVRALEGGVGRVLAAGVALALAALGGGWYAGIGAFVLVGALALCERGGRRLWPALFVGAALCLPVAYAYHALAAAPDSLVDLKTPESLARLRRTLGAADPRIFWTPGDFRSPDFSRLEQNASDLVHTAYLGVVLVVLALWRGRRPALWLAVAACLLLAMGPVLVVGGGPVAWHGRSLPLPFAALEGLPGFAGLSLVYRIATLAPLALGLLADRAPGWLAPLVLAETLSLSPARGLPALSPAVPTAALTALAAAPEGAAVSLPAGFARTRLYEQSVHGHPLTASLNSGMNRAGLRVLAACRKVVDRRAEWADVVRIAQEEQVRYVVTHHGVPIEATFQTSMRALKAHATVLAEDEAVRVYALY